MFSTVSKFLRAVVAVVAIIAICNTATAAEIYNNGGPATIGGTAPVDAFRMDTQGTVGTNTWHPYDDFSFTPDEPVTSVTVTGVEVVLTSDLSLDEWTSAAFTDSMTYEIREDDVGVPGPPLADGSLGLPLASGKLLNPVLTSSTLLTLFDHTIFLSFDLQSAFDASVDTTYWIGIHTPTSLGFLVANWALSDSITGNAGKSTRDNGASWNEIPGPSNASDASFKLFGPDRIDIKPWRHPNRIYPRFGLISVAVFGSEAFDDDLVDPTTLKFGPAGTASFPWVFEGIDLDHDGYDDFIVFFRASRSGIKCGDTEATVTGATFSGKSFFATDSITTVGCGKKRRRWFWR